MATVSEIMTGQVRTVAAEATIGEAARAMVAGRFGSVVVTSGKMLLGILTERDLLRATAAGVDPASATVSQWMTEDPVTTGPDTDTEEAATTMLGQGFRHLPVVDGSDLVGIVSLRDLLSARIGR